MGSEKDHIDAVGSLLTVPVLKDDLVGKALAVGAEHCGLVAGVGVAAWSVGYLTA